MNETEENSPRLIEPGLLRTFRAFVGIRLFFALVSNGLRIGWGEGAYLGVTLLVILGETAILLVYLFSDRVQKALGKFYLPIGLAILTLFPLVEAIVRNQVIILRGNTGEAQVPVMTLLVVVILIAWQYSLLAMLIFCILSGVILFFLGLPMIQIGQLPVNTAIYTSFSMVVFLSIVGFVVNRLMATQRQQRTELDRANLELKKQTVIREQLAATQERNRLAGELHDVLAHGFSALTVELEAIRSLWFENRNHAYDVLNSALRTANNGLNEARRAIRAIRAEPLETFGLVIAVHKLAVDASKRGNLLLARNISGDFSDLPADIEQCIYRVAQEAITNVLQHANAKKMEVKLQRQERSVLLEITDDGVGFQAAQIGNGFGLQGMRTRAQQLGGTCEFHSRPNTGTIVRMQLPGFIK